MAATDKPYRNQQTLNVVFAVSCVAMLLTVLWMLVDDYNREFKTVQRKFRDVEAQHSLSLMLKNMPDRSTVEKASEELARAREARQEKQKELQETELVAGKKYKELVAERDKAYARYQDVKADFDALMSNRDIDAERVGEADSERRKEAAREAVKNREERLKKLKADLDAAQKDLDEKDRLIKENYTDKLEPNEREV